MKLPSALPALLVLPGIAALKIPSNVKTLYDSLAKKGDCTHKLESGFYNSEFERGDMSYCGDHLEDYGIVYLQGPGKFSNMDVDCDGQPGGSKDDGRCRGSSTTVPSTSVRSLIQAYDVGIHDLSTYVHPFVVFGNSGDKPGWRTFDPRSVGVEKASVMAVVCGDQMFYGLWGDSNGHHGERPSVGEASLSLATACYGKGMNGGSGSNSSHNEADVLYIAFTGKDAVPGRAGAHWRADHFDAFHNSIESLGNKLVNRIGRGRQ